MGKSSWYRPKKLSYQRNTWWTRSRSRGRPTEGPRMFGQALRIADKEPGRHNHHVQARPATPALRVQPSRARDGDPAQAGRSRTAARGADPRRFPGRCTAAVAGIERARHRQALHQSFDPEHVDRLELLS